MAHSAFSFDRRYWRLCNSSSRWLYWNLANVACPEPKREEDRSLAATGFNLGQENVAQSYSRSDHVDIDTLLPRILTLQFVHFRLVRIRFDQVNTFECPVRRLFQGPKAFEAKWLRPEQKTSKLFKIQNLNRTTTYVVVLYDEMEFLFRFLMEENPIIAATTQPSQLNFITGMIQVGHTFEHEPKRVAEQKLRCFEFLVLVNLASVLL